VERTPGVLGASDEAAAGLAVQYNAVVGMRRSSPATSTGADEVERPKERRGKNDKTPLFLL
jgi:hypothetical protein